MNLICKELKLTFLVLQFSGDSKFRLLTMRKPELEKYKKLAEKQTVPSIAGFVREERGG